MKRFLAAFVLLATLFPGNAFAHLGSPDVFYEGNAGPYPLRVTIRMPSVVPGRAEIFAQVQSAEPVEVAFAPIASKTAISNTPPAEAARALPGGTNLFTGELWLMTSGGYGIDIHVHGKLGEGAVQIPVNSVATRQLPLPPILGKTLFVLAVILFWSGVAIIAAAAGESVLPPGASSGPAQHRRYWTAVITTTGIFALLLFGGWKWWLADEHEFRQRLREGGWPEMAVQANTNGTLDLTFGHVDLNSDTFELAPDHGKLAHVYLVRQPDYSVFAHLHPTRNGEKNFAVTLPPLPEGNYEVFCDLTLAKLGVSSTATNFVHLPAIHQSSAPSDPDDSWSSDASIVARDRAGADVICHLPGGRQIIWKTHPALQARQPAGLSFEVRDEDGKPAVLEQYMGMMSHAVILRSDGKVFAHLHPSGNFSMAAQKIFDTKLFRETAPDVICGPDGIPLAGRGPAQINLPYEFPAPGDYRLWVQVKTRGQVLTGVFDTTVR